MARARWRACTLAVVGLTACASSGEPVATRLQPSGSPAATAVPHGAAPPTSSPQSTTIAAVPTSTQAAPTTTTPSQPTRPVRVLMVGDSTALMTGVGLRAWGVGTGRLEVADATLMGCGIGRGGHRRYSRHEAAVAVPEHCDDPETRWRAALASAQPDLVVVQTGPWDVTDRILPGDDTWRSAGDPTYDAYLSAEIDTATRVLAESGATVVWLTAPEIELGRQEVPPPAEPYPGSDPARTRRLNELIAAVVAATPQARLVDLRGHLAALPGGVLDARLRPDGVHFTEDTSLEVARWLGPTLVELAGP